MTPPALSPHEGRVLGVLVEKQRTVPDSYPLTLNALVDGCNQKTSREPVLSLTESEARQALDALKGRSMVLETSGGRVMRYAHNVERALALSSQSVALLATLLLRGPQTAGELRLNADRLHRFADISAVEAFLAELAGRPAGALVAELPRTPGTRETRWMELLSGSTATIGAATRTSGAPPVAPAATRSGAPPSGADAAAAREAIAGLRNDVAGLRDEFAGLRDEVAGLRDDVAALREAIAALRGAGR